MFLVCFDLYSAADGMLSFGKCRLSVNVKIQDAKLMCFVIANVNPVCESSLN